MSSDWGKFLHTYQPETSCHGIFGLKCNHCKVNEIIIIKISGIKSSVWQMALSTCSKHLTRNRWHCGWKRSTVPLPLVSFPNPPLPLLSQLGNLTTLLPLSHRVTMTLWRNRFARIFGVSAYVPVLICLLSSYMYVCMVWINVSTKTQPHLNSQDIGKIFLELVLSLKIC